LRRLLGVDDYQETDLRGFLTAYYAMVRFIDDGVGRILQALEQHGLAKKTIVVFCSDHGDFAGEHGMVSKGGAFYESLVHVPLILSAPGIERGGRVEDGLVNLIDVVPTLFRLQGIDIPRSFQGRLLPGITEESPLRYVFSEYGAGGPLFTLEDLNRLPESSGRMAVLRSLQWREAEGRRKMIRSSNWKYVHDPCGDLDELYNLAEEPLESVNLITEPENRGILEELRQELLEWSIQTEGGLAPTPLPDIDRDSLEDG